ncbi:MAG: hypothetical protein KAZ38_08655 [Caldilineaceae bacterium]|nr:hypothetical protein [Caldilineaceae bacterium]
MLPIVNGLETDYKGQLAFEQIDANQEIGQQRMRDYGLRGHPSYVIIDAKGAILWSATGQLPEEMIRAQLQAAVQK